MAQRRPFTTYWGTPYSNFFTRNRNSSTENHFLSNILSRCFCNDRHLPSVCKAVQLHKALIWQWCRHSFEIKVLLKLRIIQTRLNTWRQWNKGKVVLSCKGLQALEDNTQDKALSLELARELAHDWPCFLNDEGCSTVAQVDTDKENNRALATAFCKP